ncbi:MAG: hypothetical protein H6601_04135 [Flavobacteriales bacterium]|nr:hypothetical protein [Flavobacteriales bacterium]
MRFIWLLLFLMPITVFGQQATKNSFIIEKSVTVNVAEMTDDWDVNLQHIEAPKPGISTERTELAGKKREVMRQYPRKGNTVRATTGPAPTVGHSFEGNGFNGVPNDNDMAISKDSIVVSVTNSRIYMFNGNTGEQLLLRSLHLFSSDLDILGSKYDPKVIYDPHNDRFVMVYLCGYTWETSKIVIAFSQTSDPTGDWNLYYLPGNPLDNESWSDYPVIGISGKDLYIGINTFLNGSQNNSGFVETCLWQVGLKEGYIGFDLNTNYYNNILSGSKKIFNICPISAADESEAENMFLLSNRNTDAQNDTIFLLEVTGRVADPNTQLEVTVLHADQPYVLPVPADQPGNQWFDTNDSRVLGGYLLNGRIYFVQSCTDPSNGRAAIFHGVIDNVAENPSVVSRIFSQSDLDYGYPNISWSGSTVDDEQSIISFNHCSDNVFGGFSAIHIDAGLNASDRVEIKSGLAIVNVLSDTLERWGDYSGSQRMYNQPGAVWAVGSFGTQQGGHGTWIAEIFSPNATTFISDLEFNSSAVVYPNPFIEDLSVEFEIPQTMFLRLELVDANGKLVKTLLEDRVKGGKNRISFNEELLTPGAYYLVGTSSGARVLNKQVLKL